jgi:cysteine desulfurase family protein
MSIYLDNAATSFPKPEQVYCAVDQTMRAIGVAPGRGGYRRSLEASRLVFEARESVARLFSIADSSRVIFTHSATEALNLAVLGLLQPGDHVVSTSMEHNSVVRPLHLATKRGVEITWVDADADGYVPVESILAAVKPHTRLVVMTHCSNVTGSVQPIAEVGAGLQGSGIIFLVDASQSAGVVPIDVNAMHIDLLAAPGHKGLLGPQGTGFLYCADEVNLAPLIVGGTGIYSSDLDQPIAMPERFESGTLNTAGIAGLKAGVEFITTTGIDAIAAREQQLISMLIEGLQSIPGIMVYNSGSRPRTGVVSFNLSGHDPSSVGYILGAEYDISVRVGLHCAPFAHRTIGTYPGGTVRVSPGYFSKDSDIDGLLQAVRKLSQT